MKFKGFQILGLIMSIVMIVPTVVTAQPMPAVPVEQANALPALGTVVGEVKGATGPAIYIVQLESAPLALYRGGVAGLQATNPGARGEARLDASTAASQAYLGYLTAQQNEFLGAVAAALGREVSALFLSSDL